MPDLVAPPKPVPKPVDVASLPEIKLRTGSYEKFTRLVFDWPKDVSYQVFPGAGKMTVQFDAPIRMDVSAVARFAPRLGQECVLAHRRQLHDRGASRPTPIPAITISRMAAMSCWTFWRPRPTARPMRRPESPSPPSPRWTQRPAASAAAVAPLPAQAGRGRQRGAGAGVNRKRPKQRPTRTSPSESPRPPAKPEAKPEVKTADAKPQPAPLPRRSRHLPRRSRRRRQAHPRWRRHHLQGRRRLAVGRLRARPDRLGGAGECARLSIPAISKAALGDFAAGLEAVSSNGLGILRITLKAPAEIAARGDGPQSGGGDRRPPSRPRRSSSALPATRPIRAAARFRPCCPPPTMPSSCWIRRAATC